jgi:cytochrome c5
MMLKKFVILLAVLALAVGACGGGDDDGGSSSDGGDAAATPVSAAPPNATHGGELFSVCAACHGPDGKGIEGLGKDLTNSEFADGLTDTELVAFIIEGRPASHELNTTGVDMLPRGGNADFSDQDLFDIVAYMRDL